MCVSSHIVALLLDSYNRACKRCWNGLTELVHKTRRQLRACVYDALNLQVAVVTDALNTQLWQTLEGPVSPAF